MASATFRIGYSAVSAAGPWTWTAYDTACTACAAHDYIKVELQSTAGVNSITVTLPTADDAQIAAGMPAVTTDQATKTATFRLDNATFRAINIQVTVNGGLDSHFAPDSTLTKSLQVVVPAASGVEALVVGETDERHRTYGYVGKLNAWASTLVAYNAGHVATLYVETTGNDATGVRGNQGFPYLTIAGAIVDAQDGDLIKVGIGTFAGAVVLPEVAAFSIVGSGVNETIITSADASATIGAQPAVTALQTATIKDCTVVNTGAGAAIGLSGTALAAPGIFVTGVLYLIGVRVISGDTVSLECGGNAVIRNCEIANLTSNEVDNIEAFGSAFSGTVTPRWDHTATLPAGVGGSHTARFVGCRIGTLEPYDVIQCKAWGCNVSTLTTHFSEDGATEGSFQGDGYLGAVTINADSVAAVSSAVLDNAEMTALTVNSTAGAQRVAVRAKGAAVSGTVTANGLTDVDIRGGTFGALAAAGAGADKGTINRTTHIESVALIAGDTTPTFAVPFPDADYYVSYNLSAGASDAFTASRSATGFTVTSAAIIAVGCYAIITHP